MKVVCILLCVAFASGFFVDNNGTLENKIVGGYYVSIEDVPYHASLLRFRIDNYCGATIIHGFWVITASHCVDNSDESHISVRTGSVHRKSSGKVHTVEKIIKYDDYKRNSKNNDIALIKLAQPIQFNNEQQPIEIAKPHDIPREGEWMRISGFGAKGTNLRNSDILKAAYVPVLNQDNCRRASSKHPITDSMFCAGNGDADPCFGDSGGPGVIRGKLYGIISFGKNCSSAIFPGVYTRVHKFYNWIEENLDSDSKICKPNLVHGEKF